MQESTAGSLSGLRILTPDDLSSGSSSSDSDLDGSSDISTPPFSPITSEGSLSDLSSPESEPDTDEVSSSEDETGAATLVQIGGNEQ